MARPAPRTLESETETVPAATRFPVEVEPPDGFDPDDLGTWPKVGGRLEWVAGRLLYMPPSGSWQQGTVVDVALVLGLWARRRSEFFVGTNEAGMALGDDKRAAAVAVWRRETLGTIGPGLPTVPPVLVVEVVGRFDREPELREKARWYLGHGAHLVWIAFPAAREVLMLTASDEQRLGRGQTMPPHPQLPDLAPRVDEFFVQLDATSG